jgi:co-chaperonin GroES (HSP10)
MASVAMLERLARASDPKKELMAALGDLSNIEIMANKVLVAIYIAPEKTRGGIIRATQTIQEDIWQGSVGLVVKKGGMAFKDDDASKTYFHGQDVKVGDWVVFRPGDAKRVQLREVDCRMVEDITIDMVIEDPEIITHRNK